MLTQETNKRSESTAWEEKAVVMAVSVLVERIERLPEGDRNELFDLIKEMRNADSREERESLVGAFLEVLEQEPITSTRMAMADESIGRDKDLDNWRRFVSERLRAARNDCGLTQQQLAERSGLPQSHISRLESGRHSPSRMTLEKIANALSVNLSSLDPAAD